MTAEDVKGQLRELKAEVQKLRAEVEALKQVPNHHHGAISIVPASARKALKDKINPSKRCSVCGWSKDTRKDFDAFHDHPGKKDGLQNCLQGYEER